MRYKKPSKNKFQDDTAFSIRMDHMNEELDQYIGGLVADLIYKQYIQRGQVKKNLERV